MFDSICAPSTPLLPSAITVVRASGKNLLYQLTPLIELKNVRQATLYNLMWDGYTDKTIVIFFKGPMSYTGEDLVEFHLHGNPLLVQSFISYLQKLGIRLAEPGEFTKRSLLNGKQNLLDVEALNDLMNASTETQIQLAQARTGKLPPWIKYTQTILGQWVAHAETNIDYGEEENLLLDIEILKNDMLLLKSMLTIEKKRAQIANKLLHGIRIVIVGRPNAGKSTLFNTIIGENRAIVTNIPGTTRDIIEAKTELDRIPIILYDTAGLRKSDDEIERLGIDKTFDILASSDIILYIIPLQDTTQNAYIDKILSKYTHKTIIIRNKTDLGGTKIDNQPCISALNGDIKPISYAIINRFFNGLTPNFYTGAMATNRQLDLINKLYINVDFFSSFNNNTPIEIIASELQIIWGIVNAITGSDRIDSTIDQIFTQFCLGK